MVLLWHCCENLVLEPWLWSIVNHLTLMCFWIQTDLMHVFVLSQGLHRLTESSLSTCNYCLYNICTILNNDFTPVRHESSVSQLDHRLTYLSPTVKVSDRSSTSVSVCMFNSFHPLAVTHEIMAALMHVTTVCWVHSVIVFLQP